MQTAVKDIVAVIEDLAPSCWAETWDNVGLQIGSLNSPVDRIFMSVDPTLSALKRAAESGAQLLVTHHPLLFHPLSRLDLDTPLGHVVGFAMENGISVYSAHTNLDVAPRGVSKALAECLDLNVERVLEQSKATSLCKLVLYVPIGYEEEVLTLTFRMRSSLISNYRSFQFKGICTRESASPLSGQGGEPEFAREMVSRLEFELPCSEVPSILTEIRSGALCGHSSFEVHPLNNGPALIGYGCVARLKIPVTFKFFAKQLKTRLKLPYFLLAGIAPDKVKKVALCGGSGSSLMEEAYKSGADLFITSELKHSHARLAEELNFCVLDIGHFHSEKLGIVGLGRLLKEDLAKRRLKVSVIEDHEEDGPLSLVK